MSFDEAKRWAEYDFSCTNCAHYEEVFGTCNIDKDCHEALETLIALAEQNCDK